jgi:hypothetical protein
MGWGELENGALLAAAEAEGFAVFVICDKNLRYQQNLAGRKLAMVELWTNHRPTLELHFARIRDAVESVARGEYRIVAAP